MRPPRIIIRAALICGLAAAAWAAWATLDEPAALADQPSAAATNKPRGEQRSQDEPAPDPAPQPTLPSSGPVRERVEDVLAPVVTPVIDDVVTPVVEDVVVPVVTPVVEDVVTPVVTPIVEDVVTPVVAPIVDQVVAPIVGEVVAPIVTPPASAPPAAGVQRPVTLPATDPAILGGADAPTEPPVVIGPVPAEPVLDAGSDLKVSPCDGQRSGGDDHGRGVVRRALDKISGIRTPARATPLGKPCPGTPGHLMFVEAQPAAVVPTAAGMDPVVLSAGLAIEPPLAAGMAPVPGSDHVPTGRATHLDPRPA